jgi:hypothetical protein
MDMHSAAISGLEIGARQHHRSERNVVPVPADSLAGLVPQSPDLGTSNAFARHRRTLLRPARQVKWVQDGRFTDT